MEASERDAGLPARQVLTGTAGRPSRKLDEISAEMARLAPRFQAVYRDALGSGPHGPGTVVLRFTVSSAGDVTETSLVHSDLGGPSADGIVRGLLDVVKTSRFPAEDVPTMVVTYPVRFDPQ